MNHDTPPDRREKRQKPEPLRRFLRLLRITVMAAALAVVVSIAWLAASGTNLGVHMMLATALGVGFSVLLAGALMALVFFSAASGADEDSGSHHHQGKRTNDEDRKSTRLNSSH